MSRILIVLLGLIFTLSVHADNSLFAKYDCKCDSMKAHRCQIENYPYHLEPIPKIIHQIWFGDHNKRPKKVQKWIDYAKRCGYEYHFWDEKEIATIKKLISPENERLIDFFLSSKNYWSASDMVRCELLRLLGGIYVDCDFNPPVKDGRYLDLKNLVALQGAVFLTENHARNIHEGALFVCNGFMGFCPNHPIMQSMCHQFSGNIKKFYRLQGYSNSFYIDACYITGPFLLNKIMNGSFQVIPIRLSVDLNMWN